MSYTIALNFEDGVSRFITCKAGETVLDAAYRQKINLPMDCSDGVCGTCKGHCEQGAFDMGDDYLEEALSEEEEAEGKVLTCQMVPSSDCVIQVPVASTLCKTQVGELTGRVARVEQLSEDSIELAVDLDEDAELTFLPGQYINIQVPGSEETRSYSFSSRPGDKCASFLIRNVPDGLMSGYLTGAAKPGERLTMTGPLGSFYLREVKRPLLMLAGGTGLAPFLSMLQLLEEKGCDQPIHMIYGVSRDDHLVKMDALETFAETLPEFSYTTVVADEASQHPRKGYVTRHMAPEVLHDGDVDVYLCGPPPMVDAVLKHFREQDFTPANFHYEKFAPSLTPASEEVA
ncbi:ring-hydroxylating dioxygenase ferredoxin reductase family protein [Halomonas sp. McH1-25]|uniref:benzoate 1,2-dioxygenase electron transfer component BenC n=1 Tax=unclassified Halomonas TaxID=2609666 RepID=UPI001EF4CCC3|nr:MULTISPECIES: benzoate 1,2-dioxygenase electron transfer component BenC [unclassified Halomonas]MCG7601300.1 ring-hydroxylating dioxygenase ferredoxin reductase family protein [Halomonas sp. McH1-25]MCP1343249.1 benzoate 1,2-dioxygenase electron transfer component BenC [Halomonas sp. FL8]MCP1360760.1 benzoate 1,2-dioxygenase electron transfer component BenC [Halomonas sp. BBD45]MCP1366724.1 benzoate 1,2-dioxygenase electron transfer component BenC [Halomonas sp. BBD48]